jgi:hypothetical protein
MKNPLATVISYLFHPLFVATYGFAIILFTPNYFSFFFPFNVKLLLLAITISFTCFLPIFNLYLLRRLKLISSLYLDDGKERTFPYLITAMFYLGMVYLIRDFHIPGIYIIFLIGAAATILFTALINLRWKISAHMMGMGGLTGSMLGVSFILNQNYLMWICFILLAAGLTGFARLELKVHTPRQVYAGFTLGMLITFSLLVGIYSINLRFIL